MIRYLPKMMDSSGLVNRQKRKKEKRKKPFTIVQMGPTGRFIANNSSFFGPSCPAPELASADNDGYQGYSEVGDNGSLVIAASLSVLSL